MSTPITTALPRVIQLLIVGVVAFAGTFMAVQVTQSAGTGSAKTLANRIVIPPTASQSAFSTILTVPGLGVFRGYCTGISTSITYFNSTAGPVDFWSSYLPRTGFAMSAVIVPSNIGQQVARFVEDEGQHGMLIELGKGNSPGARKTASVTVAAYRSPDTDWCGFQVTAVTWTHS